MGAALDEITDPSSFLPQTPHILLRRACNNFSDTVITSGSTVFRGVTLISIVIIPAHCGRRSISSLVYHRDLGAVITIPFRTLRARSLVYNIGSRLLGEDCSLKYAEAMRQTALINNGKRATPSR